MEVKNYGMLSEVIDGKRVMFVGSSYACDEYMNNHQIIKYNDEGEGITRQGLKEYFELVEDKGNWKNGFSKAAGDLTTHEERMISIAVMFFAGCVVKWSWKNGKRWIEFDGYYIAMGE
jgi:hypothetical protein